MSMHLQVLPLQWATADCKHKLGSTFTYCVMRWLGAYNYIYICKVDSISTVTFNYMLSRIWHLIWIKICVHFSGTCTNIAKILASNVIAAISVSLESPISRAEHAAACLRTCTYYVTRAVGVSAPRYASSAHRRSSLIICSSGECPPGLTLVCSA